MLCDFTGFLSQTPPPAGWNSRKIDKSQIANLKLEIGWACISAVDSRGRTIFVADAHRDDGKRFVVHADEKLTAFVELESAIREASG
jgi:hypothetical protein